ncbi:hypothetical protein SDC9_126912 [bioreactor metagenome]|uniref:Uncharacterized protein n=1 Tax=bioreactor metagenome TaxID=1076179 RepID=A0A645CRX7_9ZZZZ
MKRSSVFVVVVGPLARDEGGPDLELQVQCDDECQVAAHGQKRCEDQDGLELELIARQAGHHGEHVDRHDQPHGRQADAGQAAEQDAEQYVGADDEHQRLPCDPADGFGLALVAEQRACGDDGAEQCNQNAHDEREVSRPHARTCAYVVGRGAPGKRHAESAEKKPGGEVSLTVYFHNFGLLASPQRGG